MGIRNRIRAASHGRSPQPESHKPVYGAIPPDAAQPVILNYSQPAPTIVVLSQATDSKPLFQIDYIPCLTVTHIPTSSPIGIVSFADSHKVTLSQTTTNFTTTYRDRLEAPSWFRSVNGNNFYWEIPAYNPYQATLHCSIIDGQNYDDERDVAVAVILDSKWKKGRIEFRKRMGKDEMDLLLLSAVAEIEDLRGKIKEGNTYGGNKIQCMGAASSGGSTVGYLEVATAGVNFASAVSSGGGGGA